MPDGGSTGIGASVKRKEDIGFWWVRATIPTILIDQTKPTPIC